MTPARVIRHTQCITLPFFYDGMADSTKKDAMTPVSIVLGCRVAISHVLFNTGIFSSCLKYSVLLQRPRQAAIQARSNSGLDIQGMKVGRVVSTRQRMVA